MSYFSRLVTKDKPLVHLTQSSDILAGLVLAGFRLQLSRDNKGKLWVSGIPLKLFSEAARAELKERGYLVKAADIKSTLTALLYWSEKES